MAEVQIFHYSCCTTDTRLKRTSSSPHYMHNTIDDGSLSPNLYFFSGEAMLRETIKENHSC